MKQKTKSRSIGGTLFQLCTNAFWAVLFYSLNATLKKNNDPISDTLLKVMEFAGKYHICCTLLAVVEAYIYYYPGVRELRKKGDVNLSKKAILIRALNKHAGWVFLTTFLFTIHGTVPTYIYNSLIFYIAAQFIILASPYVKPWLLGKAPEGVKTASKKSNSKKSPPLRT